MNRKKIKKQLNDLTLLDRFLFAEAMEDPEVNKIVLEIILEKEINFQDNPQTEKEFRRSLSTRSIRIDVFSMDEDNVYDIEVQKRDMGNLPKRSRFYQGLLDSTMLTPGVMDFNELKNCYVIIIGPFDILGLGRYHYTFRMKCDEVPMEELGDGGVRIFLNTRGSDPESASSELIELLHYIEHTTGEKEPALKSEKMKHLHQRIQKVRDSEEIGVKYMQLWEEQLMIRQEAEADGEARGEARGRVAGKSEGKLEGEASAKLEIVNMLRAKRMSDEEIMDLLDLSTTQLVELESKEATCNDE